jgi:Excalibur calcium-binding domain
MLRRSLWKMKVKWPNLGRWLLVACGLLIGGLGGWWFTLKDWQQDELLFRAKWKITQIFRVEPAEPRPYRYFVDCREAHAAGYFNITRDEPSYRAELDRDGDGVACEPFPGSRGRFRFPRF